MGLDQYAYAATCSGQFKNHYQQENVARPLELAYWRKHPRLQGWMETLWSSRGCPGDYDQDLGFNGIELELTPEDIDLLESAILEGALPDTSGFFFGDSADYYYQEEDLQFIRDARAWHFLGLKVFYNSSW